jgi:DNA polymerase III psi subunit
MLNSRQQAYLDAMDIGVWQLREPPRVAATAIDCAPALKLGPGGGGILLVCATDTDSANRLANDIIRALGTVPVWAWPDADADAVQLSDAVEENLFTTVAVFGRELAARFFAEESPVSLKSASLVLLPAMRDIQTSASARRELWATICRSGMVSPHIAPVAPEPTDR